MNKKEEIQEYCLNCKIKPCSKNGCPLENNIPEFIHEPNSQKAFEILSNTTVLPAMCGRICPHEKQCQGSCIRGIKGESVQIGEMESIIGDESIEKNYEIPKEIDEQLTNKKVAIIGSGPAGLTAGAFLAKKGIHVTIYEKHNEAGGILTHGIPEFRLNKEIVQNTIEKIKQIGVNIVTNTELGKDIKLEDLQKSYNAVIIAIGANISCKMGIPGENLEGVYGGNELLEKNNHPSYKGKKVAVIGGGNVAMDSARTIKKLGADKVYVIYRRSEEQMPAEKKEIQSAKDDGIEFLFQNNITQILGNGKVEKIECIKTKLIQKEGETRLSPVNIENSNYLIDMDYVVMATGSMPEQDKIAEFEHNKWGYIQINDKMETSIKDIYAAGDIAGEKQTVAYAARSGRNAAEAIIAKFKKEN